MGLSSGFKLGPYQIQSPLGAGGMGEVYRALDTRLQRSVAIKILPSHLSENSDAKERFDREAKAISSLNHPNICTLHDVGSQDGTHFLVMEYLEGETLADRLHRGALPLTEALAIAIAVADALEKAHTRGIVHRDLKPANIMLIKNGPKLMDFGLAKPAATLAGSTAAGPLTPSTPTMSLASLSAPASPLTEKGTIVGTFQYMAPEVLQGSEADQRSDIFSFGCVLYEMLTGRRAFEGKSQFSVLGAILDKEPERIGVLQPTSPPRLDELVHNCLAKDCDRRYACIHDVKLQLGAVSEARPQEAATLTASARSARSWFILVTAGAAVLTGLFLAFGYVSLVTRPAQVVRSSILPPEGTTFMTAGLIASAPVISPDGTRLALTAHDERAKVMLYVRPLSSTTAQPLVGTEDALNPFWSPDSREIGFFAGGKLKKIAADGGPPQTLCDALQGRGGAWSKNGVIVFTPGVANPIFRVSAGGGAPEPASKLGPGENSHRWPYFLPDGQHFLFWARSTLGPQEHVLYLGTLGSLDGRPLMKSETMAIYVPDYVLFMRDQTLMAQPFNVRRLETMGPSVPIAENVVIHLGINRPMFSASDNGVLVYREGSSQGGWNLSWFTREGKPAGTLGELDRYFDPALSPDGKHLAVTLASSQGTMDVWILDLLRKTKTRLTFGAAFQRHPVWSADGKTVFYISNAKSQFHIYAKAADGSGAEQTILESSDSSNLTESASLDQRYLVYERQGIDLKAVLDIWAVPLFGDRKPFPVVQSEFNKSSAVVSPDGKWLAYQSSPSGRSEIYMTAFPGGGAKWQVSTGGGVRPRWRRDGKELFFLDDTTNNLLAVDVNTSANTVRLGTPHVLFQTARVQAMQGSYDVTADGKKFLINSSAVSEDSHPLTIVQNWTAELKK